MPGVAAYLGFQGVWAYVVGYAIEVAAFAAASYATTKLTADNFDTGFNLDTQASGNLIPIRLVYGTGTMAGVELFKQSATFGTDNFDLHYALCLAAHECEDVTDIWLDDTFAKAGVDLNWTNHRIEGGKFDPDGAHGAAYFWKHLGTPGQTVDAELNGVYPTMWDSSHPVSGCTYVASRYRIYSNTQDLFGGGPPTARFRIKGYKLYDPRLDSTNGGSGSQRIATPATWTWSTCPPLALAHFLCFSEWGPQWDPNWINWATVIQAANDCDALVEFPAYRYTFSNTTDDWAPINGVFTTGATYAHMDAIAADPQLVSDAIQLSFSGSEHRYVRCRVRVTSGTPGNNIALYYKTAGHGYTTAYYKAVPDTTILNSWVTLEFDMWSLTAGGSDWQNGTITALRLDIGDSASNDYDIDWIEIVGSQKRFQCNGILNAGDQFIDNVKKILSCFRGSLVPTGDKWTIAAGVYHAPDFSLNEKCLAGPITMDTETSIIDRFNTVKVLYVDTDNNDAQNEVGGITDATYLARDADYVLDRQITCPMCNDFFQAQRLGRLELRLGNQQKTITVQGNLSALEALVSERVNLSIAEWGFTDKVCIVEDFEFKDFEGVTLQLREDSASAYADMVSNEYQTRGANDLLTPGDATVPAPTSATVTPDLGGNHIRWVLPGSTSTFDTVQVYASNNSAWANATKIFEGRATEFFHVALAQQWYWVRCRRGSYLSLRLPDSDTSTLTGAPLLQAQPGATYNAPGTLPFVEDFADNSITRVLSQWDQVYGEGVTPWVVATSAVAPPMGGNLVLRIGDNAGSNDGSSAKMKTPFYIAVDSGTIYRITFVARLVAGDGAGCFFGVKEVKSDAVTDATGAQSWYALNSGTLTTNWTVYSAYVRRSGGSSTLTAGTLGDPGILAPDTAFITPYFWLGYTGARSAQYEIGYINIDRFVGGKAGDNLYNFEGGLLYDVDIRNDQVVTARLGAINDNPGFETPRQNDQGTLSPASWFSWNSTGRIRYVDDTNRDVVKSIAQYQPVINSAAIPANPRIQYEVAVLVRCQSGTGSITMTHSEYDYDLAAGERWIAHNGTPSNAEPGGVVATRIANVSNVSVNTTFAIKTYIFVCAATAKWFSVQAYKDDASGSVVEFEWIVVRERGYAPASGYGSIVSGGYDTNSQILASDAWQIRDSAILVGLDSAFGYSGNYSCKFTGPYTNGSTWGINFRNQYQLSNMAWATNRRWLIIASVYVDQAGTQCRFGVFSYPSNNYYVGSWQTIAGSTWVRKAWVVDMQASSEQNGYMFMQLNNTQQLGDWPNAWVDSITMIDVTDLPMLHEGQYPMEFIPTSIVADSDTFMRGAIATTPNLAGSFNNGSDFYTAMSPGTVASRARHSAHMFEHVESGSVGAAGYYAHGFGVRPDAFQVAIRCATAEKGYSIGDEVDMLSTFTSYGTTAVWADATNIGYSMVGAASWIFDKASTSTSGINPAYWRVVYRGYHF